MLRRAILLGCLAAAACSNAAGDGTSDETTDDGADDGTGGAPASGGSGDVGGDASPAGGASAGSGGAPGASGGASGDTGGASGDTGGVPGTGGASASGGAGAGGTGGSSATGGAGGAPAVTPTVRLIAIGDAGEANDAQHDVAAQMSALCVAEGGCDGVLYLGDNFYDGGPGGVDGEQYDGVKSTSDPKWLTHFEDVYDLPGLDVPFYAVLGNHDYSKLIASFGVEGNKQAQVDYTALPVGTGPGTRPSDRWYMPQPFYEVRVRHVHLFALDTMSSFSDAEIAEQLDVLQPVIEASDATWKIVFGHHPRFTSGRHRLDQNLLSYMFDLMEPMYCNADFYMNGHDHDLELIAPRQWQCPNTHFVVSGAGAKVSGDASTPYDETLFFDNSAPGFVFIELAGERAELRYVDRNGVVLFTQVVTKPS